MRITLKDMRKARYREGLKPSRRRKNVRHPPGTTPYRGGREFASLDVTFTLEVVDPTDQDYEQLELLVEQVRTGPVDRTLSALHGLIGYARKLYKERARAALLAADVVPFIRRRPSRVRTSEHSRRLVRLAAACQPELRPDV